MSFKDPLLYVVLSLGLIIFSVKFLARWRLYIFSAFNILFVALVLNFSAIAMAILVAFLIFHFLALRVMICKESNFYRSLIFWTWLIISLFSFVIVKKYYWITDIWMDRNFLPENLITIGLSFVLFRQVCMSIECRDYVINKVQSLEYLNYNLAFWTFLAGPLQRFDDFRNKLDIFIRGENNSTQETLRGLNRAVFGFIKMFVIASAISKYATTSTFLDKPNISTLLIFLLAFPAYIYINFSGYCDIMIGIARVVGFKLPENFNNPYLARNLNDFWARWHITLSTLLRDYLYFPLQTSLARNFSLILSMVVATLFSFLIMGVWHGNSYSFAIFGILHGIGVVAVNLYSEVIKKYLNKDKIKSYKKSILLKICAIIICQSYVIITFLPFNYSSSELNQVIETLLLLV